MSDCILAAPRERGRSRATPLVIEVLITQWPLFGTKFITGRPHMRAFHFQW